MTLVQIKEMVDSMDNSQRVLIDDDEVLIVDGFLCDGVHSRMEKICEVLGCKCFGCLPLQSGPLKGLDLWYVDDFLSGDESLNVLATTLLGNQVFGGMIYGPVLVARAEAETVEE